MTRWLGRLAAPALGLLVALGAAAQAPFTLERAEQAAAAASAVLSPRDALSIGERWPSPVFGPLPWALLPPDVAPVLHARVRFLDVVLSDLHTGALNEQIAIAFARSEQAATGPKKGTSEALNLERQYRDLLAQRDAARAWQRAARSLLAIAVRAPGSLQSEVDEPEVAVPAADAEPRAPVLGVVQLGQAFHAERLHAWHLFDARLGAARSELLAARKRLQEAEVLQDEQRAAMAAASGAGPLRLGDAMAAVALALLDVRRAEYRLVVFHAVARALAGLTVA